ncbi:hypothetical protein ARMGADRAFT_61902 [Armillaria gallica]|uniref:Uncharacterized protein n=1 Tax=Armillaria gallica TaxID=47427 RepID=A0A2H3DHH9_ARMGA|nr:hypothetical protein ARMGADRAFT_61902 [Armillaria gallica]
MVQPGYGSDVEYVSLPSVHHLLWLNVSTGAWDYFAYRICDAFSIANWEQGSSMVAVGLNWKLSIVCVSMGFFIMGTIISINGVIGARLRIPFPVIIRSSFGFFFSRFAIVSRCILAIFWLGVGAVTGGQSMQQLINAIWPSFRNVPNHLPDSIGMTTAGMCAYIICFIIQFPFLIVPYTKIRWFFRVKAIIAPVFMITTMGVTVRSAGVSADEERFEALYAVEWRGRSETPITASLPSPTVIEDYTNNTLVYVRLAKASSSLFIDCDPLFTRPSRGRTLGMSLFSQRTVRYGPQLRTPPLCQITRSQ